MNFKKFISGVSALTIAASAFAAMSVTASAALAPGDYNATITPIAASRIQNNGDGTWTTAGNAGNAYAMAAADLSGLEDIDKASSVTLEFDSITPKGARLVIGIGDKAVRGTNANGSSKSSYNREGIGMYFGSSDGQYWRINGGSNNSGAFGDTIHAVVTLNRAEGTYSYALTAQNAGATLTGTDIATTVDNFTIVEAYTWVNNGTFTFSDVSVSYTIPDAPLHNYVINAVDENDNVIAEIATGSAGEGSTYGADVAEVVEANGVCYQLDSSVTGFNVSYTMGNADATQTVQYNRNDAIKAYKNAGYVAAANSNAGYSTLGTVPAGNYKVTVYLKDRGDRGVYIRNKDVNNTAENVIFNFPFNRQTAAGVYEGEFTLTEETTLGLTGFSTGDSTVKTNQSSDFNYVIVEYVSEYIPPVTTTEAGFAFKSTIEKLAGSTVTLKIAASNGIETKEGAVDITDKLDGFDGELMLAVILTDVPEGITIESATIEVE